MVKIIVLKPIQMVAILNTIYFEQIIILSSQLHQMKAGETTRLKWLAVKYIFLSKNLVFFDGLISITTTIFLKRAINSKMISPAPSRISSVILSFQLFSLLKTYALFPTS